MPAVCGLLGSQKKPRAENVKFNAKTLRGFKVILCLLVPSWRDIMIMIMDTENG